MNTKNIFWVLFISMVPLIELRGAIPVGSVLGLPFYLNYALAVVGNLIPVPFILLLIPYVLDIMERFKIFRPIVRWVRSKAMKNKHKIGAKSSPNPSEALDYAEFDSNANSVHTDSSDNCSEMPRGAFLGLLLFVLIPFPGTGAWTGSLVASLFGFPKLKSFLAIMLGVLGCGLIMCLASYGVLGFLSFLI